jgi:hypothetical protein
LIPSYGVTIGASIAGWLTNFFSLLSIDVIMLSGEGVQREKWERRWGAG